MGGWDGAEIVLQARCQKKKEESSYCQDPGGSHSKANCMGRGGSFKAMGTENSFHAH